MSAGGQDSDDIREYCGGIGKMSEVLREPKVARWPDCGEHEGTRRTVTFQRDYVSVVT